MDTLTSLAIVTLAALVHASFQLSVSVLTLLSGHALGAKKSQTRVLSLTSSFVFGAGVMTVLLLSLISYVFFHLFGSNTPLIIWAIVCGLLVGVGLSVWVFYYRRGKGTSLWIPRSLARHLSDRSKATKDPAEAFSLGLTSVIAEILFIIAPLSVAALVLVQLSPVWQFAGIVLYTLVSLITLLSVWVYISSGHKISDMQKWREQNKYFLQFAAGLALVILGGFVYVCKVIADTVGAM
ncbi:hypothetical protein CMN23_03545 [Candidatus Saccharibacteria bacterium]|nr:hypothetical protein [Candidatus Saccharibacteria bacterium]|tara:strand:+ start:270 stop:983 length:714 start_codon:yes stop_codon:yes gene_type:complete